MLRLPVSSSSTCTSSWFRVVMRCVGSRIGSMNRTTRSRIFLDARRPVEKIAISLPSTDAVNAAQYCATEKVLPNRRGVTIITSVRNSRGSNSRSSRCWQRSKSSP